MFDISKEVPSLELCKRLKELGYPQEGGGWYWIDPDGEGYFLSYFETSDYLSSMDFKAPTCRELGEWLPRYIFIEDEKTHDLRERKMYIMTIDRYEGNNWRIMYKGLFDILHPVIDIFSNIFAKMLIWLVENGYIKLKK